MLPSHDKQGGQPANVLKKFLTEKLAVNRAVGYMLVTRGWQFISAPITIYLINRYFGERLQGYYYVFLSLLAAQHLFELGLNTILFILASHEWADLGFDENGNVTGKQAALSRLSSLVRYGDKWYRWTTLIFVAALILIGRHFIRDDQDSDSLWLGPWILAVLVNGISLTLQPRLAILEGCHQVVQVNYARMFQAIMGSVVVWTCILTGGMLWTIAASNAIRLLWEIYLVKIRYRRMFVSLRQAEPAETFSWKNEIWPLQWRLAIQSFGQYFSSSFFVPLVDQYHGKAAAGRMGMTWSIVTTLQAASLSWPQTRLPEFGALVAKGKIRELDRRMSRIGMLSVGLYFIAGVMFVAGVWGLGVVNPDAANRFLTPVQTAFLLLATIILQVAILQHSYIRLFKRDPFLIQNVFSAILTGTSAWYFGSLYGATGIICSYLLITCFYTLPISTWILVSHRQRERLESVQVDENGSCSAEI